MTFIAAFILLSAAVGLITSLLVSGKGLSLEQPKAQLAKLRRTVRSRGSLVAQAIRRILIYYFAKARINDKCPSCGHHKGRITCDIYNRCLAHVCAVCGAEWGTDFVRAASDWLAVHTPPPPHPASTGSHAKANADAFR